MIKHLLYSLLLLGVCSSAYARECHLAQDGVGGTLTLTGGSTASPLMFKPTDTGGSSNYYTELDYFEPTLDRELWSYCDGGFQGYDLYANTASTAIVGSTDGRALFPTNIPGIFYAVKLYSTGGGGGYFPVETTWTIIDPGKESYWDSKVIKLTVTLYQAGYFQGNVNNATAITPKDSRTLGQMRVGKADSDDNNPWNINVTPSSFSVPIRTQTCSAASANNGTNNVDFGDIMFSSLREGHWPEKDFDLTLSGCTNAVWVRFKLSSTKSFTDAYGLYVLTNTLSGSDAAEGMGIQLMANFFNNEGAGGINIKQGMEVWAPSTNVGASQTYNYNFIARFERTADEVKAGQFKAIGTFTIDYF